MGIGAQQVRVPKLQNRTDDMVTFKMWRLCLTWAALLLQKPIANSRNKPELIDALENTVIYGSPSRAKFHTGQCEAINFSLSFQLIEILFSKKRAKKCEKSS